jgi:hypothetical protein
MPKRPRAGEDQLEIPGLEEVSPSDPASDPDPLSAGPEAGERDPDRRAPFAMGRLSSRTREVHMAGGDPNGPIPGPWTVRAVVRPGPGTSTAASAEGDAPSPTLSPSREPAAGQD